MSRHHYDDPFEASRRRTNIASNQTWNNSPRRPVAVEPRQNVFETNVYPNRQRNYVPPPHSYVEYPRYDEHSYLARPSGNRTNIPSHSQPSRRYRLEDSNNNSHTRNPQFYRDNYQDYPRSSDPYYASNQYPSANHSSPPYDYGYDYDRNYPRNTHSYETYEPAYHQNDSHSPLASTLHSNQRSTNNPIPRQQSNPTRSSNHPPSSTHGTLIHQSPHGSSLLSQIFQAFFGGSIPFLDDEDDFNDRSTAVPMDFLTLTSMMGRPNLIAVPGVVRINLGDLLNFLDQNESPAVGLSEADIERLPTMTYKKKSKSKSDDEKCSICLSEYKSGETVKQLRCKHIFHPECIDPWLKTSIKCPICRGTQN